MNVLRIIVLWTSAAIYGFVAGFLTLVLPPLGITMFALAIFGVAARLVAHRW